MTAGEATERFFDADRLFRKGEFEAALEILSEVDRHFPGRHRVLYPKARCLSELGRYEEALTLCERLIEDHAYERAARLKQRIERSLEKEPSEFDDDDFMEIDDAEDMLMEGAVGTHSSGTYITRDAKLSDLDYAPKDPEDELPGGAGPSPTPSPPAEDRYIAFTPSEDQLYTPGSQILERRNADGDPEEIGDDAPGAFPSDFDDDPQVPTDEALATNDLETEVSNPALIGPQEWAEDRSLSIGAAGNLDEAEEEDDFPISNAPIDDEPSDAELDEDASASRFAIKPVRLLLLIAIIAAMAMKWIPYWLGGGVIVAYFVLKFLLGRLVRKAFEAPFKMKGRALEGATLEVHSVERIGERAKDDGEDARATTTYLIEVTIHAPTPQGNFTHWEPGELVLADARKTIASLNDLDDAFGIDMIWIENDGEFVEDEGVKVSAPRKLRVRAHLDPAIPAYQFAYYNQGFGEVRL